MERRPLRLPTELDPVTVRILLICALTFGLAGRLASETLSLTTTYPSPVGIYNQIITTGSGPLDTKLVTASGNVGVGVSGAPGAKLHLNGSFLVQGTGSTPAVGMCLVATDTSGHVDWGWAGMAP